VTPISSSQKKSAYVEKQGRLRTKRRRGLEHSAESGIVRGCVGNSPSGRIGIWKSAGSTAASHKFYERRNK